jgi:hypothetical protein
MLLWLGRIHKIVLLQSIIISVQSQEEMGDSKYLYLVLDIAQHLTNIQEQHFFICKQ